MSVFVCMKISGAGKGPRGDHLIDKHVNTKVNVS